MELRMTSYEDFRSLADSANVVPLVETMFADMHTPVSTYMMLRDGGVPSFLFESAEPNERIGRYSFIGTRPAMILRERGGGCEISDHAGVRRMRGTIFDALREQLDRLTQAPLPDLEGFPGGFVGYLGYDTVRHLERLPVHHLDGDGDDAAFGLFTSFVCFDHLEQRITVVHNVILDPSRTVREQYEEGRKAIEALMLRLRRMPAPAHGFTCTFPSGNGEADRDSFCRAVERAKQYIHEGDIFQVVLSRRMELSFAGDLFAVYRALRVINPSPYLFFIDFGATKLAGSSPEVLVRVRGSAVEVFPIAGTRRRGKTEDEDGQLAAELLQDEKELAEHIMLVDLGRNDVGRISDYGSVRVPVLKRVERYSHVMHLVSEVRGSLKGGCTALDALKACFPAGTVSGAPKVRAMEIIHELEPCPRSTYAGAVGYLGLNGSLDTCIAIRTIVAHHDRLRIQAGAGIVADSIPEREYQETVNKAQALLDAVYLAAGGLMPSPAAPHPGGGAS
jgi:anthranilate synthase component 1